MKAKQTNAIIIAIVCSMSMVLAANVQISGQVVGFEPVESATNTASSGGNTIKGNTDTIKTYSVISTSNTNFTMPIVSDFISFPGTTNFSAEPDLNNVTNLSIGTPWGQIQFPANYSVNASGEDYNNNVIFGDCFVAVNSVNLDYTFNASAYLLMNNSDGHCGDNTIFKSDGTILNASDIKNGGKVCTDCKTVTVGGDTVTFRVPHFSSYAIGSNSNITVDANDPKEVNETVLFTAVYKNSSSGDFITGANCQIDLPTGSYSMNEGVGKYTYQTAFEQNKTYEYNVTCSKTGYNTLLVEDSFQILPAGEAVPEFSTISILVIAVLAMLTVFFVNKKKQSGLVK